jgi:hypothetical protein
MKFTPEMPLNFSRIKYADTSPKHFKAACLSQLQRDTLGMRKGSVGHCLTLEPDRFKERYIVWEHGDRRAKGYKAFAAEAAANGLVVLTKPEFEAAREMAAAINTDPIAAALLSDPNAIVEQRLFWTDKETGLALAGTPDYVSVRDNVLPDIKTTALAEVPWEKYAGRQNLHCQIAMYIDSCRANGIDINDEAGHWIVPESSQPHDVVCYHVPSDVVEEGRRRYQSWLVRVAECIESGEWPGRAGDVREYNLPLWRYLDREEPVTLTIGGEEMTI